VKAVWIVYVGGIIAIVGVGSAQGWPAIYLAGLIVWVIGGAFVIRWIELAAARRDRGADDELPSPDEPSG
jgi:hypothetical protein